jgi:hypothetical protein
LFPRARGWPDRVKTRCSQSVKSAGGIGETRLRGAPDQSSEEPSASRQPKQANDEVDWDAAKQKPDRLD